MKNNIREKMKATRIANKRIDNYMFNQVPKGVMIKEGLNFAALLGTVLYKHNYWKFDCKKKYLTELFNKNDEYWFITQCDLVEECGLSARTWRPLLQRMKDLNLLDFISQKGKPIQIKCDRPKILKYISDQEKYYITYTRTADNRELYKKVKAEINKPCVQKIKRKIKELHRDQRKERKDILKEFYVGA